MTSAKASRATGRSGSGPASKAARSRPAARVRARREAGDAGVPERAAAATPAGRADAASSPAPAGAAQAAPAMPLPDMFAAAPSVSIPPARLAQLQSEYLQRWQKLVEAAAGRSAPGLTDKRFAHEAWHDNGPFAWTAALYLLNAEFLQKMAASVEGDRHARERVRFATQQVVDMLSPANFLATNPEAQRRLLETQGDSLRRGIENLVGDVQRGRISQTDEAAFEVGRNVATTPGAVVYQNELVQLIQYAPSTAQVGARPLMLVPPCINKFYIMDLQPENSLVAYAAAQGHTVFMVSWRNVGPDQGHLTWDDYLRLGIVEPIRVVREISGSDTINALGFCVGGTILATALAALAARGERPVAALTMMTSLLDFDEPGVLGVFIDEASVALREQSIGAGGLLSGKDLATTFSFLRPNDLVWNYYVANYLKGERPPAFDLLYWNSDSTNLPGPMYCWYLRHMYLQNELVVANRLESLGEKVDLRRIALPTFVFGAREDHIVPWKAAFATAKALSGPVRFVLGASGHIAGAINPPSANKRSYWTGGVPAGSPDTWLEHATEHPGSWWKEWSAWLAPFRGPMTAAPRGPGSRRHPPIEPAPGSYVKQRAD